MYWCAYMAHSGTYTVCDLDWLTYSQPFTWHTPVARVFCVSHLCYDSGGFLEQAVLWHGWTPVVFPVYWQNSSDGCVAHGSATRSSVLVLHKHTAPVFQQHRAQSWQQYTFVIYLCFHRVCMIHWVFSTLTQTLQAAAAVVWVSRCFLLVLGGIFLYPEFFYHIFQAGVLWWSGAGSSQPDCRACGHPPAASLPTQDPPAERRSAVLWQHGHSTGDRRHIRNKGPSPKIWMYYLFLCNMCICSVISTLNDKVY